MPLFGSRVNKTKIKTLHVLMSFGEKSNKGISKLLKEGITFLCQSLSEIKNKLMRDTMGETKWKAEGASTDFYHHS